MSLMEKIDAEIAKYSEPSDDFSECVISTGITTGLSKARQLILAEQKEPCENCKTNPCWLCKDAGECTDWIHCAEDNRSAYRPRQNYCHICGRPLNQSPGEPKPLTKGDKIRESNESLARCIEALVAIALGDSSFIDVERRIEWLNQPQEGE